MDENTGRAQPGRRFSQGLHQAIEAKEHVTIQRESKTLATITYQNFFKLYYKLSGMTGTATTEGEEFDNIYNLNVLAIPTNKPVIRVDLNDKVFFNQHAKRKAVIDQIEFSHMIGQPLLIGTSSIHTSEFVSSLLSQRNITHSILNAKYHEQEANIVSRAGQLGSVVVATNMAGRGTDIKLEPTLNDQLALNYAQWVYNLIKGNTVDKQKTAIKANIFSNYEYELTVDALKNEFSDLDEDTIIASYKSVQSLSEYTIKINLNTKKKFAHEVYAQIIITPTQYGASDPIIEKSFHYGLGIIGTEKHESRRIDNQLRGRAGRQGDAGFSVFYVALDDTIMRKIGGQKIQSVAALLLPKSELESLELTQSQFTNASTRAQKQLEGRHFGTRKHLFDYDSVINRQRQAIYAKRDAILETLHKIYHRHEENGTTKTESIKELTNEIINLIEPSVSKFLQTQHALGITENEVIELLNKEYGLNLDQDHINESFYTTTAKHISQHITAKLADAQQLLGEEIFIRICANIYLTMIDKNWIEHIDQMQYLREKVGLVGYAQLDPLIIYKKESHTKYQALNMVIKQSTVSILANTDFAQIAENIKLQQQHMQMIQEQQEESILLEKLKSAATQQPIPNNTPTSPSIHTTTIQQKDNSEFEIIELNPNTQQTQPISSLPTRHKLRPNDKVSVKYTDGRIEFDIKYKKVIDDIKAGKAEII